MTQAPFCPMASVVNGMNVCRRRTRNETLHCTIYRLYVQWMISKEYIRCTISTEYIMFTAWIQLHWGDLTCQVRMMCVQQNRGLLSAIVLQQNCPIFGKHKIMQAFIRKSLKHCVADKKTVSTCTPSENFLRWYTWAYMLYRELAFTLPQNMNLHENQMKCQ